jgi:type IV pilus assembly protein PilO
VSRRVLYSLAIVGLVIVAVIVWFFVLSPIRAESANVQQAIQQEHVKQVAAEAKLSRATATRTEGKKNEARLLELAKMVPNNPEIPSLLLQIQNLANESGITFVAVTPGSAVQSGQYEIVPLQVQFTGTFFDLSDFVYRAEQMVAGPGRLLAVKEVALETNVEGTTGSTTGSTTATTLTNSTGPILKVTMTLYAFDKGSQTPVSAGAATTPTTAAGTTPSSGGTSTTTASGA